MSNGATWILKYKFYDSNEITAVTAGDPKKKTVFVIVHDLISSTPSQADLI